MTRFVPFTPGGSMLADLEAGTEAAAWTKLLAAAAHMGYATVGQMKARGYTVEQFKGGADGRVVDGAAGSAGQRGGRRSAGLRNRPLGAPVQEQEGERGD